ncbi:MAG: AraC family transcriptional regulator [Chitinophagaceae bacterium]|nr:MAG: AraC family transcriptional regulator [Chitinophagaceae bacterium]
MEQQVAVSFRQKELMTQYVALLDEHIRELKESKAERTLEIRDFAAMLHVHPVHLSNTVKEVTGRSTCDLYEERLLTVAKELLADRSLSIAQVATRLIYDPSNFTKFFKRYAGMTPKEYRNLL